MASNKQIKEEISSNIVRIASELHVNKESDGALISGLALPFNKTSRNDFCYDTDSIKQNFKTLEGATVLFNHDMDKVLGHVKNVSIGEEGLNYEIDLDPNEKAIIEKIRRGDLNSVSIQCIYDGDKTKVNEKTGVTNAWINEFLEMSVVSIPGFADTTAQLMESFKNKLEGETMKKKECEEPPKEEGKEATNKEQEEEPKKDDEKEVEGEEEDPVEKLSSQLAGIEARLEKIETFVKEQSKEADDDEEKPDEKEEEAKREEAIRKDKEAVTKEALEKDKKTITTKELKTDIMEEL